MYDTITLFIESSNFFHSTNSGCVLCNIIFDEENISCIEPIIYIIFVL